MKDYDPAHDEWSRPDEDADPDARPGETDPLDLPLGGDGADAGQVSPDDPPTGRNSGGSDGGSSGPSSLLRWLILGLALVVLAAIAAVVGYCVPRAEPALIRVEPDLVELGTVPVGAADAADPARLTVRNGGERPLRLAGLELTGEAAPDVTVESEDCLGRTLGAGDECTVTLAFVPREPGPRLARLAVRGDASNSPVTVALVGGGAFREGGGIAGGAPDPAMDAGESDGVERDGDADTTASTEDATGDATEDADGADGDGEGARTGGRSDAGGETDAPPAPRWVAEPEALAFGPVRVGESERLAVTVRNRGTGAARLTPARLTPARLDGAGLTVAGDACGGVELAPGDSCRVEIAWRPAGEGELAGALVIAAQGPVPSLEVPVTGAGVVPRLALEPGRLDFGELRVGGEGERRSVTVRSTGSGPVRVGAVAVTGSEAVAFRADGCGGRRLDPGAVCTISVRFRPLQEGTHEARLSVDSDAAEAAAPVRLRGAGAAARLSLDRTELDFGTVRLPEEAVREVTLASGGRLALELGAVRLEGEGARAFEILPGTCEAGVRLEPGARCTVSVRFIPETAGTFEARLLLDHGAGDGRDGGTRLRIVPLSGTAAPPPAPRANTSPRRLAFDDTPVGGRSNIVTLTLSNRGDARLPMGAIEVAGAHAGDFRIVPGSCQGASFVAPGGECTVGVRFAPTASGPRRGQLVVGHDGDPAPTVVALAGRGR